MYKKLFPLLGCAFMLGVAAQAVNPSEEEVARDVKYIIRHQSPQSWVGTQAEFSFLGENKRKWLAKNIDRKVDPWPQSSSVLSALVIKCTPSDPGRYQVEVRYPNDMHEESRRNLLALTMTLENL